MSVEIKDYRTADGVKTVLIGKCGHKYMQVLMMTSPKTGPGLVVRKVPLSDERYMRTPIQHGRQKADSTIIRTYRAFGNRVGMTKAAKSFLTAITKAAA